MKSYEGNIIIHTEAQSCPYHPSAYVMGPELPLFLRQGSSTATNLFKKKKFISLFIHLQPWQLDKYNAECAS